MKISRNRIYFTKGALFKAIKLLFTKNIYNGKYIREFENVFSQFINVKHSIALSSGKLALYLSLKSLGAEPGDKVILSDFNVPEVPALLQAMNLSPVLIDINPNNFNININLIEKHIDSKTKFLLVTHIFGVPVDMEKIIFLSTKYNLKIIEDACQALGSEYKGKKVGSIGEIGYFSFGILKPLNALNGGMVVTNNDQLANYIRKDIEKFNNIKKTKLINDLIKTILIMSLTNKKVFNYLIFPALSLMDSFNEKLKFNILQGKEISCIRSDELGRMKTRFSNLQALVGLENLKILPDTINKISQKAELLTKLLNELGIIFQRCEPNSLIAYFKYAIRVKNREKVLRLLFKSGIDITYGYMKSCSSIKNFYKFTTGCPESLRLMNEHVYLPIYSLSSENDLDYLIKAIKKAL